MADVARAAGVSRALVSVVYRGAEGASEQTRRYVLGIGEKLGYRRNTLASRLASKGVRSIGVLVFDVRNDLMADVLAGIQAEADERNIGVVVGISDPDGVRDARTINELLGAQVDVLIMISGVLSGEKVRDLSKSVPVVLATRAIRGLDSVVCSENEAARLIVGHLVEQGRRDIVHLAPAWRPSWRVTSFEEAMHEAGLEPRVATIQYDGSDAFEVTRGLLEGPDRPQVIYANNDNAAYHVLDAIRDAGLRVPEDVAVVGFDNLRTSKLRAIDLTSVDQQPVTLGRMVVQLALERVADPSREPQARVLQPRLVVRGTT